MSSPDHTCYEPELLKSAQLPGLQDQACLLQAQYLAMTIKNKRDLLAPPFFRIAQLRCQFFGSSQISKDPCQVICGIMIFCLFPQFENSSGILRSSQLLYI